MATTSIYARVVQAYEEAKLPSSQRAIGASLKPKRSQGAIGNWKKGTAKPSIDHAIQIGMKTGVCVEWILTGRGPKYPDPAPDSETETLLELFRGMPAPEKSSLLQYAQFLCDRSGKSESSSVGTVLAADLKRWRE